jgi:hypothetical protein
MFDDTLDDVSGEVRDILTEHLPRDLLASLDEAEFEADALGEDQDEFRLERSDSGPTVVLNLDAISDEDEETIIDYYFEQGGIFSPSIFEDIELTAETLNDKDVQEIREHFSDFLTENDVKLISRCLSIRRDWESDKYTPKKEMRQRVSELANEKNFGDDAKTVSKLVSSGYYDENGYIRELFDKVDGKNESNPQQRLYNLVLDEQPFTRFVSSYDRRPQDVTDDITDKLESASYYMVPMDFVDVRAQGGRNRDTLEKAIVNLHLSSEVLAYKMEVNKRETVCRINPSQFEPYDEA